MRDERSDGHMRKLMMLAAMVAMVMLLAAAPVMADTLLRSVAVTNQINDGNQIAKNDADQDANASQYQYNPGGAGGDVQFTAGNSLQDVSQFGGDGGAGGTGSQYQYQSQSQDQDATATGPTFIADQNVSANNKVL